MSDLVVLRPEGLYCPDGDFHIDPWRPVARAVITHAHADHARPGHQACLVAAEGLPVVRARLGATPIEGLAWGERRAVGGVTVSLHPAGHILGAAQVRIERGGEVWVVSGDYRVEADATCTPFEPVRCHTFITESTFGLPVYRWRPQRELMAAIDAWWSGNAAHGRASILYGYALGKAQRILAGVDPSIGPIVCHAAVEALNRAYRAGGIALPTTRLVGELADKADLGRALVIAPPSAASPGWLRRFPDPSDAFASGWMALRGARRRRAVDRGFVLSDHADWPGLCHAIAETGASRVIVTHGQVAPMVRWLSERGLQAQAFETEFTGEEGAGAAAAQAAVEDAGGEAAGPQPTGGEGP